MSRVLVWQCGCGESGRGEKSAQAHVATGCTLFGRPWTNPDYPRPEEER